MKTKVVLLGGCDGSQDGENGDHGELHFESWFVCLVCLGGVIGGMEEG
jgi:hypothetical protein